MKNGLGRNVNAGLKPLAQYVEALRADERVGFNRLSCAEAGIFPADTKMKNGLGRDVNAGLKPLAQFMEALRANERVE